MLSINPKDLADQELRAGFGPEPLANGLERTLVLRAAKKTGTALNEFLRYMANGENSAMFAFEEEIASLLADALRMAIEIERPRLELSSVVTEEEVRAIEGLHAAIIAYQGVWGRA